MKKTAPIKLTLSKTTVKNLAVRAGVKAGTLLRTHDTCKCVA
jgi:hypothetical protein